MNILNALARLRDDIKTWVTNNINALNSKVNDKLDAGVLPAAINDALTQAKESGEFDGADGYTPVRGADYWTDADKAEIQAYIDSAIQTALSNIQKAEEVGF